MRALLIQRLVNILLREKDKTNRVRLAYKWTKEFNLGEHEFEKLLPWIANDRVTTCCHAEPQECIINDEFGTECSECHKDYPRLTPLL